MKIFILCLFIAISYTNGNKIEPMQRQDIGSAIGNFIQGIINSLVDALSGRSRSSSSKAKVNCVWGAWSACSVTCTAGFQTRGISQGAENGGTPCSGSNYRACTINNHCSCPATNGSSTTDYCNASKGHGTCSLVTGECTCNANYIGTATTAKASSCDLAKTQCFNITTTKFQDYNGTLTAQTLSSPTIPSAGKVTYFRPSSSATKYYVAAAATNKSTVTLTSYTSLSVGTLNVWYRSANTYGSCATMQLKNSGGKFLTATGKSALKICDGGLTTC